MADDEISGEVAGHAGAMDSSGAPGPSSDAPLCGEPDDLGSVGEVRERAHPVGTLELVEGHAVDLLTDCGEVDLVCTDPPYAFGGDGAEHALSAVVAIALRMAAERLKRGHWMIVFAASSKRSVAYMEEAVRGIVQPVRYGTWVKPESKSKVKTVGWAWGSVTVIAMRKGPKNAVGVPDPRLDWIMAEPLTGGRRAELPPKVAEWAVAPFAVPGGIALDPFSGSGALPKAAANAGMQAIGYELHPPTEGLWTPDERTTVRRQRNDVSAQQSGSRDEPAS